MARKLSFFSGFGIGFATAVVVLLALSFFLFPLVLRHRNAWPLEDRLGLNRVKAAIPGEARHRVNPLASNPANKAAGAVIFSSDCIVCHGPDGKGDTGIGKGLYPPAADLTRRVFVRMRDGQIFWIARHGLSFVGMPSFKEMLSDGDIWKAVVHVRALQQGAAAAPAGKETTGAPGGPSGAPAGEALFHEMGCARCHGEQAQGDIGPKLAGTSISYQSVLAMVRSGGSIMPAYSQDKLSDGQVKEIYNWLESLK